jgi:xanthosine utilization system XapX-like protein
MPTVFRFALICAVVAGVAYAALYALATVLEPAPREVIVVIPPSRYAK